jgi:hypothetical protein
MNDPTPFQIATGPRAVRRRRDFWYSSMSDGAAPSSGRAQTAETHRIENPTAAFIPDNGSISDSSGCSSRYRVATFVA